MTPHLGPASALALLLLLLTLGYISTCVVWPFTNCRRCSGTAKRRSWINPKTYRSCRACNATGQQLRFGRKIWNFLHHLHRDAR